MSTTFPRRLLLAEDSPANQMVAVAFLKKAGYHVDVVANGVEAVQAMSTAPYDLVLMDVSMPEMDGLAATRAIRALPPPAGTRPIIAMTADTQDEDRERCLAAGMDDHLPKPVERTHFLETVARWLDGRPHQATMADAVPDAQAGVLGEAVLEQLARDLGPDLLAEVVGQFLDETTERAGRIAVEADPAALAREAHTLKSTAATFGASRLSAAGLGLERACHSHDEAAIAGMRARLPNLVREAAEAYRTKGLVR